MCPLMMENTRAGIFDKWQGRLEMFPKITLATAAVAYVAGMLILNLHLREFGIHFLGFLKLEYIMVGTLWVFLSGLAFSAVYTVIQTIKEFVRLTGTSTKGPVHRLIDRKWRLFGIPMLLLVALHMVIANVTDTPLPSSVLERSSWTILAVLCVSTGGLVLVWRTGVAALKRLWSTQNLPPMLFQSAFLVAFFLPSLSLYADRAYPLLSRALGGGRPQVVRLIIAEKSVWAAVAVGLPLDQATRTSGPLEVILEASDFFLIAPPPGFPDPNMKSLRLRKDMVDGIRYSDGREASHAHENVASRQK
jgi:hypothetical protein